jgi:hypothetical protein
LPGKPSLMGRSVEQAANNEATFRRANEGLEKKAAELGFGAARTPYLCECEDPACTKVIELTREEYEAVRAHPKRFVMVPDHQEDDDRVIEEQSGFTIIEKSGEEGDLVAERDPRPPERSR